MGIPADKAPGTPLAGVDSHRRTAARERHRPRPTPSAERGQTQMKDLVGKTAFVTGAASGIGLGIATSLAQAGVKVMLCDIEEAALARAVEGLKFTNADVDAVKADVSLK